MLLQVLPSLSPYDAISQHVIRLKKELDINHIPNTIIANYIHPSLRSFAQDLQSFGSLDESHILYHMSISSPLAEKVCESNSHLDIWYHNITPAEKMEKWEPYVALELRIARHQFSQIAVRADRGVAASRYSESELRQEGCRHTFVMPVLFDISSKVSNTKHDRSLQSHDKKENGVSILSVGRYAPHKRIEQMIKLLSIYRETCDSRATLTLVGSNASKWYRESLELLISKLNLKDAVIFCEGISDQDLANLYANSDIYLCLSEHEGFCVPLLEAQYAELPIVALDTSAIAETVNNAGIVLPDDAKLIDVASAIDLVVNNSQVRDSCIRSARHNIKKLDIDEEARRAVDWLIKEAS